MWSSTLYHILLNTQPHSSTLSHIQPHQAALCHAEEHLSFRSSGLSEHGIDAKLLGFLCQNLLSLFTPTQHRLQVPARTPSSAEGSHRGIRSDHPDDVRFRTHVHYLTVLQSTITLHLGTRGLGPRGESRLALVAGNSNLKPRNTVLQSDHCTIIHNL